MAINDVTMINYRVSICRMVQFPELWAFSQSFVLIYVTTTNLTQHCHMVLTCCCNSPCIQLIHNWFVFLRCCGWQRWQGSFEVCAPAFELSSLGSNFDPAITYQPSVLHQGWCISGCSVHRDVKPEDPSVGIWWPVCQLEDFAVLESYRW